MDDLRTARRELNGAIAAITLCKLLLVFSSLFLSRILSCVLRLVFDEGAHKAYFEFSSYGTLPGLLLNVAVNFFVLFVPISFYFYFSGKRYSDIVPMGKPEFLQVCYGVGATFVVGNISANLGNSLFSLIFSLFGMEDKYFAMLSGETSYPQNFWLVPLFACVLAVLPAFFEETIMRGIGLSATKKFGIAFSLFFSGFFFAFLHSSWTQLPFAFTLGIVLAYFTLRFNTIWIAVISHFVFNFNSVVQCLILQNGGIYANILLIVWTLLFGSLFIGLAVAGLIIYGVKKPHIPKSQYTMSQKMRCLFSSPFFYGFIILTAIQLIYLLYIY